MYPAPVAGRASIVGAAESSVGKPDRAVNLPAVGVPLNPHVQSPQRRLRWILDVLGQEDCASAGSERGFGTHEVAKLLEKTMLFEEIQKGCGFTTGNNDGIDRVQLLRFADKSDLCTKLLQSSFVGLVVTLNGKDADVHSLL